MRKAVIMARGLGTRMRKSDNAAPLTEEQAKAASTGVKAMIPIGRPFLDYVLSILADVGMDHVCLIIGPEHDRIRSYYLDELKSKRVNVEFAIQEKPLGTANAVVAAEKFAGNDPFLVINSDNYYPRESFEGMRDLNGPGVALYGREALIAGSNIPAERVTSFAVAQVSRDGYLEKIIEKPDPKTLAALPQPVAVSMNCWRFDQSIFDACRKIEPSSRGEYEIPHAVQYCIDKLGVRFRALVYDAPVLDLSSQNDIKPVAEKLAKVQVRL
jgi:dTDP-glucose pyrophosphorylase